MKKFADCLFIAAAVILSAVMIVFQGDISPAVVEALKSVAFRIIPSLFAVTVLSNAVSKSGAVQSIIGGKLVNGSVLTAFLLGNFGGYPVGASVLKSAVEDGRLSRDEASKAMVFCFGCGPAFASGVVGLSVFGDVRIGLGSMLGVLLANFTAFIIYIIKYKSPEISKNAESRGFSTALMVESVNASALAMINVAAMIVFFSAVLASVERLFPAIKNLKFLAPIAEITRISNLTPRDGLNIPIASALMSFGGICVILQVISIAGGRFSLKKFLISRPIMALLASGYGIIIQKIFTAFGIAIQAAIRIKISRSESFVPLVCVLAMVMITVSESFKMQKNRLPHERRLR